MEEIMKCVMCENQKKLKSRDVTVKYKESGLDNVTIHNVQKFVCDVCGEEYLSFGDADKLHQLIAHILVRKKDLLSGKEVRFLRSYLGYSTKVFSRLSRYDASTISRIENDKQQVSPQFDVLIRSLVANKLPDRDYRLHDLWINKSGDSAKRIELSAAKKGWTIFKKAA
jgi:putative zinc finger/helix-turn-helix YgiT family protein